MFNCVCVCLTVFVCLSESMSVCADSMLWCWVIWKDGLCLSVSECVLLCL